MRNSEQLSPAAWSSRRHAVGVVAAFIAIALATWAVAISVTEGIEFELGGIVVRSHNERRPFMAAIVVAIVAVWLVDWRRLWRVVATLAAILAARLRQVFGVLIAAGRAIAAAFPPARLAVVIALATSATSAVYNSWTGSGPDSFAYASQAAMFREGRLRVPMPLAREAPWPDAVGTLAPWGYRPDPSGAPALVPINAPGLPLVMAAIQAVFGHCAGFTVVPITGGLVVWLTFVIGRRIRSPETGLIAALLLATSPAFMFQLMWPMTDVPAAFWAALLIWGLLSSSPWGVLAGGLAASIGILTRNNFVLIAGAGGLWLLFNAWRGSRREGLVRLAAFAAGTLPGVLTLAWLNLQWYGAAIASGYGTADSLMSADNLDRNVRRYFSWLLQSSPLALHGLLILAVPNRHWWTGPSGRGAGWLLLLTTMGAWSVYLVYLVFDDWWYLRFLLPAYPAMFLGTAAVFDTVRRRNGWLNAAAIAIVLSFSWAGFDFAYSRGVLEFGERRFATVASLVDQHTAPDAVILTLEHSGTVRYYAGRETVRWDALDPAWLDRTVAWLAARGRHPYLLLEERERALFNERFAGSSIGPLAFIPLLSWRSREQDKGIHIYDLASIPFATIRPGMELMAQAPFCAPPAAHPWPR